MPDRTVAPALQAPGILALPAENVRRLTNGVTLHSYYGGEQPVGMLSVLFCGGYAEISRARQGLLSAMLLEGGGSLSPEEVAARMDFNGAVFSPMMMPHFTGFSVAMLDKRVPEIAGLLSEVLGAPHFPEKELENTKLTSISRLELSLKRMRTLSANAFSNMILGPEHPLAIQPTPEEIDATTRKDLLEIHSRLYRGGSCHTFLAQHVSPESEAAIVRFLESIPCGEGIPMDISPFHSCKPRREIIRRESALQCSITAGLPAMPRTDPDYLPLRMAVMALGGYFGSRLMTRVREEKGLTYGIHAGLYGYRTASYVAIEAECDNSFVDAVLDETAREMLLLRTEPPRGEELERLRMHMSTDAIKTLDSPASIMSYYQTKVSVGLPDTYFADQQRVIANLTPDLIADAAARYLDPAALRISIAGGYSRQE